MKKKTITSLFDGALTLTVAALAVKIIGVVYKIPLSYILGDGGMGYFNTAYTVYGFFYVLCSAGVPKAITCIISENLVKNEREAAKSVYKTALRFFALFGGAICVVYTLLSPFIVKIIGNEKAFLTMLFIGPSILFVATGGVARGYLSAQRCLAPIAVSQVIEAVFKLCLGLAFAYIGSRLHLYIYVVSALAVLGITIGSAFSTLYLIKVTKRLDKGNITGQRRICDKRTVLKKIAKIAVPITLSSSVLAISNLIDMAVIMRCLSMVGYTNVEANEIYGNYTTLSIPMFNLIISLVTPLTVYLLPELIEIYHGGDRRKFSETVERTSFVSSIFVCPCACIFYFFSFDVLDILFTSVQSVKGYSMLSTLAFGLITLSLLNVANTAHEATGRLKIPIISLIVGAFLKAIMEPIFILVLGLGEISIPLSTNISYAVSLLISVVALKKGYGGFSIISGALIQFLLSVICFSIPYYSFYSMGIGTDNILKLILLLSLSFLAYGVLIFLFYFIKKAFRGVKIHKKTILQSGNTV